MNIDSFFKTFPNETACLKYFKRLRYPDGIFCAKCEQITKFTKVKKRAVYECSCGYQVRLLTGTIFSNTNLPLRFWFYAIFVVTKTRSGLSAKQLERELDISYPSAFRMLKKIRSVMQFDDEDLLEGTVEIDETYIGGMRDFNLFPKEAVWGAVERGGRAVFTHVPDNSKLSLITEINKYIAPGSYIMSDQNPAYMGLRKRGYTHDWVVHRREFVSHKDINVYTQTIESLWSQFKRNIHGVYRNVSPKYLQHYADEYTWRYNNRHESKQMFELLMQRTIQY